MTCSADYHFLATMNKLQQQFAVQTIIPFDLKYLSQQALVTSGDRPSKTKQKDKTRLPGSNGSGKGIVP
uniref:Uncharacterized protein n=1 Tax=Arundo donax TaxID=35708 RepID=A0A0A9FB86_ARUDO